MVMATGSVCQQLSGGELSHEMDDTDQASAEATALHERLVAYVHALAGGHEPRSGVWVEHSYARPRGSPHAPAAHVRVLLAPRLSVERADVDVERLEPPPPDLPALAEPELDDSNSDTEHADDWEERVTALAPSAVHARLASQALDTLRRMRLERLAGGGAAHAAARTAARRLRLALAGAAPQPGAAAWLHATLHAYMPAHTRRLYAALTGSLVRAAPRLAARLTGTRAPEPGAEPLARVGPPRGAGERPWLAWVGCGRTRLDARWTRRLGALLHTRLLAGAPAGGAPAGGAPDAWCAALAGSVRAALADMLAEAGERPVILGGIGAGAALATALAGGAGSGAGGAGAGGAGAGGAGSLCGLLLLAPPLLTAEGARDTPDDVLAEVRLPMLVVAGTGAAACWRGAAREVTRSRPPPHAPRRVLELRGADDALRLPAALQRRHRLPQHALDAAVAEECARWAMDTATHGGDEQHARERRRRDVRGAAADRVLRVDDEEEYSHLPAATRPAAASPAAPLATLAAVETRSDKLMETVGEAVGRRGAASSLEAPNSVALCAGRVVSRGSGATPLALLPPRRRAPSAAATPSPPAAPLAPADIMRLPIVFADDEAALDEPAASPVTVTSGSRYTRVIVASRGGPHGSGRGRAGPGRAGVRPGGVRPGGVRPGGVRPGSVRPGGVRPARPVLLRRGLRLLPRVDRLN